MRYRPAHLGTVLLAALVVVGAAPVAADGGGTGAAAPAGRPAVVGWPTYMHDAGGSGVSDEKLSVPLRLQWAYQAPAAPAPAWPAPARDDLFHKKYNIKPRVTFDRAFHVVCAGGRVYFGSSADHKVYCLDLKTGREVWTFHTEGPVRLAPTIADDMVLVGSDDGAVYALAAGTGKWRWKFLAGSHLRIPGNGKVISLFPIRTNVLVTGGVGHFCAGLFPTQGVYYCTIDIRTGKLISKVRMKKSAQGYLKADKGRVHCPGGRDPRGSWLGKGGKAPGGGGAGVKARPDYPYAAVACRDLSFGGGDGKVAAFDAGGKCAWSAAVEGKACGLAIADGRLLVSTDTGRIYCFAPAPAAGRLIAPAAPVRTAIDPRVQAAADRALGAGGATRGYALLLGAGDGSLAEALAWQSELKIVCVEADEARIAAVRKRLDAAGLSGRVVVVACQGKRLAFTDYLFNLVINTGMLAGKASGYRREEILRVTRPCGGVAVLGPKGRQVVRRGDLPDTGRWSHAYADAGNSACSGDKLTAGEMTVQWFGRPGPRKMVDRHNRAAPPLYAGGRLFISGCNHVYAVDAYNGTILWERPVAESVRAGMPKNAGNMVATDDSVFVASGKAAVQFDAQTGRQKHAFGVPVGDRDWGGVFGAGGLLIGTATPVGASRWQFGPSSWRIAYLGGQPVICSDSVFAFDAAGGERRWCYTSARGMIPNPAVAVGAGCVFFVESHNPATRQVAKGRVGLDDLLGKGADLVALDLKTGKPKWRKAVTLSAIKHVLYLSFAKGTLLVSGSLVQGSGREARVRYALGAFDAADGRTLWDLICRPINDGGAGGSHGELTQHPAIVGGAVYLTGRRYDLRTGKALSQFGWRSSCGSISTSAVAMFFRRGNPQVVDLAGGARRPVTTVTRPGCWINIIPAGGLVLIPEASSGCTCPFGIQTSIALRPKRAAAGNAR